MPAPYPSAAALFSGHVDSEHLVERVCAAFGPALCPPAFGLVFQLLRPVKILLGFRGLLFLQEVLFSEGTAIEVIGIVGPT